MNFYPTLGTLGTPTIRRRRPLRNWPFDAFDELLEWAGGFPVTAERGGHLKLLPLDVEETPTEYIVKVDAAGVERNNIEVTLEDKTLMVSLKETEEKEKKDKNYLLKERYEGSATRAIELPLANIQGTAEAQVKDGVLTIKVAKAPSAVVTKVPIK